MSNNIFDSDFYLDVVFTYRLVCDNKLYHVANGHVLGEEFSLTGQRWLIVDLCCWGKATFRILQKS